MDKDIKESINSIPEILEQIERTNMPKEQLDIIEESLAMMSVMQNTSDSVVARKINDKHIDKYLDDSAENMRLAYKDRTQNRIMLVIIIFIITVLIGFVIYIFKDYPNAIEKIIFALTGLISGGLGGYGLGKTKRDE